jgi:hypothetical protein
VNVLHCAVARKRLAHGVLLAAGAAGMTGAPAQTPIVYSLSVPAEIEHDSNPRMTPGDARATTWVRLTPKLSARQVRGADEYSAEAALSAEKSSNQQAAKDRLDPRVQAAWKHADGLNTTLLAAALERRAFRALDVDEHVPAGVDETRTLFALNGNWLREWDARTSSVVDLRQEWARYSGTRTPDSRRTAAELRLNRQQTERRNWYVAVNGQAYRSDAPEDPLPGGSEASRSTVVGALVGVGQALSEAVRVDGSVGPVHFSQRQGKSGWQGALKATYEVERWGAALEVSRRPSASPTFAGLAVTDQARVSMHHDLDALTRVELHAARSRAKAVQSTRTLASAAWVRQWSPSWEVAVRASRLQQDGPGGSARATRISFVLVYRGLDL